MSLPSPAAFDCLTGGMGALSAKLPNGGGGARLSGRADEAAAVAGGGKADFIS